MDICGQGVRAKGIKPMLFRYKQPQWQYWNTGGHSPNWTSRLSRPSLHRPSKWMRYLLSTHAQLFCGSAMVFCGDHQRTKQGKTWGVNCHHSARRRGTVIDDESKLPHGLCYRHWFCSRWNRPQSPDKIITPGIYKIKSLVSCFVQTWQQNMRSHWIFGFETHLWSLRFPTSDFKAPIGDSWNKRPSSWQATRLFLALNHYLKRNLSRLRKNCKELGYFPLLSFFGQQLYIHKKLSINLY